MAFGNPTLTHCGSIFPDSIPILFNLSFMAESKESMAVCL